MHNSYIKPQAHYCVIAARLDHCGMCPKVEGLGPLLVLRSTNLGTSLKGTMLGALKTYSGQDVIDVTSWNVINRTS